MLVKRAYHWNHLSIKNYYLDRFFGKQGGEILKDRHSSLLDS